MNPSRVLLALLLLGIAIAIPLQASNNPQMISYQGRLLTAGGAPVPDAGYWAEFRLFSTFTGGMSLWAEMDSIHTAGGDFTHLLGSINPIPDTIFPLYPQVWLEVTIGAETLTPRVRLTSTGYSLQVHTIDQAKGGTVSDSVVIFGSSFSGPGAKSLAMAAKLALMADGLGSSADFYEPVDSKISPTSFTTPRVRIDNTGLTLYEPGGTWHTKLVHDWTGFGGGLFKMGQITLDGDYLGTGNSLFMISGSSTVTINTNNTGDLSVALPNNSVNALECVNEPGIANVISSGSYTLTTTMQDLQTITVTIPTEGYIFLVGKVCEASLYGTTGPNFLYLQIDTAAGGSVSFPNYSAFGAQAFASTSTYYYSPMAQRTYYKPAGTHTFRLEASRGGLGAGAGASAFYPTLTATFYPTAYGTVSTVAGTEDLGRFENVLTVPAGPASPTGVTAPAIHVVDLRELELRAAKAQAEAERLQRQLLEEKTKQQLDSN